MYNGLVEKCFKDCVDSFRRKDLESSEEKVRRWAPAAAWKRPPLIATQRRDVDARRNASLERSACDQR